MPEAKLWLTHPHCITVELRLATATIVLSNHVVNDII